MLTLRKNVKKTEKEVNIKLSGDINITNSNELKNILKEFLTDNRKIRVIFEKVETFDLSAVQLLYAFKREREAKKLKVQYDADLSQSVSVLLQHANITIFDKE
ncbi:MAG TPA: STAS domain-containing protein [Salinivirgaceae bacterium]|nr:STAS domain-containing protein [Salinivirgaceae bacterium]